MVCFGVIVGLIISAPATLAIDYMETISSVVLLDVVDSEGYEYYGSGFYISTDGFILTNAHVIMDEGTGEPADEIYVCMIEDEYSVPQCWYSAEVIAYNVGYDLALVAPYRAIDENWNEVGEVLGGDDLYNDYVDFSDYNPEIGEELTILGFPDASLLTSVTLTEGIVSGFTMTNDGYIGEIATDATINPGNSGGPAYNFDERVVGVVNALSTTGVGGNYGYIVSNDIVYLWFWELVEEGVLNSVFVEEIFTNDNVYVDGFVLEEGTYVFDDVEWDDKYAFAISFLKDAGVVNGHEDGTFKPYDELNRAELMKVLIEAIEKDPSASTYNGCFNDVADEWFARYVCFAKTSGWIDGFDDGSFKPGQNVTKAEAIKMILEVFGEEILDSEGEIFDDVADDMWYAPYIYTAWYWDLLEEEGGNYGPNDAILRGEVSENLFRMIMGG